ncbi:MAG: signal peptidase II [Candidatus Saganbacteria bacterium]|nr:signal peptidase II [Candidatus Saganbacteria bacterium]
MFTFFTLFIFALDQILKSLVNHSMFVNQSIPLIKGVLHITYVQNTGAAFGLFAGWRSILLLIGLIVVVFIIYINSKLSNKEHFHFPLCLILGGSLGNLFDRLFRHHVIDFIDFRIWPVFNLADIMINVGFFFIVFRMFFDGKKKKPGRHQNHACRTTKHR